MALRYGFFNSVNGDRKYSADDMTYPYKGIVSDGVVAHPDKSDGFQVVAGTGLQVKVKAGFGLFAGKWCENDSVVNLALSPAHVTLARIDTVYIKVDLSEGGRRIDLLLNTGTPSSSPTAMVFNQTSEAKYFRLADIRVNANAKSISQSNITDKRPSAECGFVTNLLQNSDISATYAQWEQQFREWFDRISQHEFETFMEESQERVDAAVSEAGATVDEYEERINQSIENANDTAERLDTDVRQELEGVLESANNTISTLDTETREQVNQFLADSQNSVDTCIGEAEQAVNTLETETREEFNQFLADSQNSVDQHIESSQQEFDTWFGNVQQTLNQNTLMTGYFQKFIASEDNTAEVPINITAYTSVKDVLQVHINGMLAVPDVDYTVIDFEKIIISKPVDRGTVVMFTVFKTIDGSEAETVVQQVADLSRAVDELKGGGGGGSATNSENFTFVVDSNAKLTEWANNVTSGGQDYTSVLIRRGEWECNLPFLSSVDDGRGMLSHFYGIDIGRTKTKRVFGEAGSLLKLRTTVSIPESSNPADTIANDAYMIYGLCGELSGNVLVIVDAEIENVHINLESDAHHMAAFCGLFNLSNCRATVRGRGGYNVSTAGYQQCYYLEKCSGEVQGDYGASLIINCFGVSRCWASGPITSTNNGQGDVYSYSFASLHSGDDYKCADTANGGFNNTSNPSA